MSEPLMESSEMSAHPSLSIKSPVNLPTSEHNKFCRYCAVIRIQGSNNQIWGLMRIKKIPPVKTV